MPAAPAESLRQAHLFEELAATDEQTVAAIDARLATAASKLEAAIDAVIARPG